MTNEYSYFYVGVFCLKRNNGINENALLVPGNITVRLVHPISRQRISFSLKSPVWRRCFLLWLLTGIHLVLKYRRNIFKNTTNIFGMLYNRSSDICNEYYAISILYDKSLELQIICLTLI